MKSKIYLIVFLFLFFTISSKANAQEKASGSSAIFNESQCVFEEDKRAKILKDYLKKQNSPLSDSAQAFVKEADKHGLDWKFVAAISGVESSFGLIYPYNSYNAWGWGIYGDKVTYFPSYGEGIKIISKSLKEDYMGKWGAKDVNQIGRFYAASPTWASNVARYMNDIEKFKEKEENRTLPISI